MENDDLSETMNNCQVTLQGSDGWIGALMPIKFQIKTFLELLGVFEKIWIHTNLIMESRVLSHFINRSLWKKKLSSYDKNTFVIPYFMFIDDTQVNNPIGSHSKSGKECCVYYCFGTLPPQYSSRIQNIFVAMLSEARKMSKYGDDHSFSSLICILNDLAKDGLNLLINGNLENNNADKLIIAQLNNQ